MKFSLISIFLLISLQISANSLPPDSVGVKKVEGKKYLIHKVDSGEGWFGIAKKYNLSLSELRLANKESDKLQPGDSILIPTDPLKVNDPHNQKNYTQQKDLLYYYVKEGENLFQVAKKYDTSVDSLRKWNRLKKKSGVAVGQRLIVGTRSSLLKPSAVAKDTLKPVVSFVKSQPPDVNNNATPKSVIVDSSASKQVKNPPDQSTPPPVKGKEVNEHGVASWIGDEDINPNKYFALHRTAPVGTVVKVTNKMNKKYVFVKVVGVLPETGDNTDLVVKVSKASAEKLGVRDQRFQCDLNYMVKAKQ